MFSALAKSRKATATASALTAQRLASPSGYLRPAQAVYLSLKASDPILAKGESK
jgi:hypothetical protein